ncbi:MAG: GHKL domain-containing protein [Candidatus Omnitrophica bacterium]|nr:GHKL domain-containing protein [Candidatus Omnitrophota bacterium]MBU4478393.1 GHKL domain-containing protein [Candidatus Omnitrophota bacterium]MCG2704020.1 ATP-binding protein [Candidatus Omnitrophota bacterium]
MLGNKNSQYAVIFFRFGIATVILLVNAALFGLGRTPVYFLISAVYVLTIVYSLLLLAKVRHPVFFYTQIIIDIIIETMLVHYTGGIDSVLGMLFPLSIIAASIMITPRAAVITAFLGSAFYSAIVTLEFFNFPYLPSAGLLEYARESSYVFSLLYFRVTVFCIIGFLSAYIAEQLNKKDKVVLSLQEKLRREDRLSAIGKLAARAAHEIRNPLASISGCVEALKESLPLDENNKRLFDLVMKETSRLNNIINGLLEYTKPKKLRLEQVCMDELIDEMIFLVKNSRGFKEGVVIKKEDRQPELKVTCDAQQIKQVFFNLLINAVEAVEKSGRIIIRQRVNANENKFFVDISDNGCGISDELQMSLFEPFSSGKEKGIGLGLAIASAIIREHGGTINLETKPGKGTTFYLCLPIAH